MPLTKAERKKLQSLQKRAETVGKQALKLARDTNRELNKQMEKS
jgi:hypothetical protein